MKRSYVVELLTNAINDRIPDLYSYFDNKTTSQILDVIEELGMLPPFIAPKEGAYITPILEWEPEDSND